MKSHYFLEHLFWASYVDWGHRQAEGQAAHQGHCPSHAIAFFPQLSITLGGRKKKGIAPSLPVP